MGCQLTFCPFLLEIIYGLINSVKGRTKEINIASGETIMFCLKNRFLISQPYGVREHYL
jgi:hypothetical protein